jgi:hypothetical protein
MTADIKDSPNKPRIAVLRKKKERKIRGLSGQHGILKKDFFNVNVS